MFSSKKITSYPDFLYFNVVVFTINEWNLETIHKMLKVLEKLTSWKQTNKYILITYKHVLSVDLNKHF